MDDETALRCLQQILDQLGIKYSRTKPSEGIKKFKVVGNKFDTSELLKGERDETD